MKKMLLVVPHQDDEINLAGNILDKLENGYEIFILYSSLDIRKKEGKTRKKEAYDACEIFGIEKNHIIFLDYPDTPNDVGEHYFTNGNKKIIEDIKNVIYGIKPELIIATDFDYHSDHRMLSIAFDTAIGLILREQHQYAPIVFKGFCYETAYYSTEDYKATQLQKSVDNFEISSNCSYVWKDRISVASNDHAKLIWNRKAYKGLKCHKSQYAILHAKSIINADNVYWNKRTDNLLFQAKIQSTVGDDIEKLRDFKIIDTEDIITINPRKIDFSKGVWKTENKKEKIEIIWDKPVIFDRIILHGNPNDVKPLKTNIKVMNHNRIITEFNQINEFGRNTEKKFQEEKTEKLEIFIYSDTKIALSEIEILYGNGKIPNIMQDKYEIIVKANKLIDTINEIGYICIILKTKILRKIKKWFIKDKGEKNEYINS